MCLTLDTQLPRPARATIYRSTGHAGPAGPAAAGLSLHDLGRRAARPLLGQLAHLFGRVSDGFGILMYHRVCPLPAGFPELAGNVSPERFRAQLGGLLDRGYQPWPLQRALAAAAADQAPPPGTFVVTFDDGYENLHQHAWPVLRELGVPATVFLATAYLGSADPFPFDDWTGAGAAPTDTWRPLTRRQCDELLADGLVELGCHTHTHQVFCGRPAALAADLAAATSVLRKAFGLTAPTFAFPYGICDPEMLAVARMAGLRCALTTETELVQSGADPFGWGRFHVEQADTADTLAGYIGGWYQLARRLSRRLWPASVARSAT